MRSLIAARIGEIVLVREDSSPGERLRPIDRNARNADGATASVLATRRFRIASVILTIVGTIF